MHAGNDGHGDAGYDQAILDGGRAGFIFQKMLQLVDRFGVPGIGCRRKINSGACNSEKCVVNKSKAELSVNLHAR
jgi:hypothetical protein